MQLKGNLTIVGWDHPRLILAREQGDPEMIARAMRDLTLPNGQMDMRGYEQTSRASGENLITLEGKKFTIDLHTGVVSNTDLAWYFALFSSDSTPTEAWDGDSFAASGGDATEFTGYTAATRQECAFDAAAGTSRVTTTNSTRGSITISSGVTATIYGSGLTNNSTKQYSSGSAILLRAARLPVPEPAAEGQVKVLAYEIYHP